MGTLQREMGRGCQASKWEGYLRGDEDLGTVGVGAGVCHGEHHGFVVLQCEVLV